MLSLTLGPLSLPVSPLLMLLATGAAALLAGRLAGQEHRRWASDGIWTTALSGLLGARLGHLLLEASAYLAEPLAMIDIRDGGWYWPSGVAVGAAWLAWKLRRAAGLRQPLVFAACAGMALWTAGRTIADSLQPATLPALPLVALEDGRSGDLQQLGAGTPLVVNLWATWCAPCRAEMPVLAAAQQRESRVRFVFVNVGENAEQIRRYLRAERLGLREVWLDEASRAGAALGSHGLPTTLFFDAEGRRAGAHLGVLNAAALQGRLRALRTQP